MGGTREGGLKAKQKILAKDPDFYRKLAKKARKTPGGANAPGSFKKGSDAAKLAGQKGGKNRAARLKKRNGLSGAEGATPGESRGTEA